MNVETHAIETESGSAIGKPVFGATKKETSRQVAGLVKTVIQLTFLCCINISKGAKVIINNKAIGISKKTE